MKTFLGELEQIVMNIVWDKKNCTPREVLLSVKKDRKLAYTTIATILQRLTKKGLLTRRKSAIGFTYAPKLSKELFSKNIAQSFLNKFIDSYGDTAIFSFADSIDMLPEEKRKHFLKIIDEYERNK